MTSAGCFIRLELARVKCCCFIIEYYIPVTLLKS
jgi:hypothetical protein